MKNPLLDDLLLPKFVNIKAQHFEPAISSILRQNRAQIKKLLLKKNRVLGSVQIDSSSLEFPRGGEERAIGVYNNIHNCRERRSQQSGKPKCEGYNWDNLIEPLEESGIRLHAVWAVINHLNAVTSSKQIRDAYKKCLPKVTAYYTEQGQNVKLYQAIKSLYDHPKYFKSLTKPQQKVINDNLRDFKLSGVTLAALPKAKLAKLQTKLSQLQNKFTDNILDATQGWTKLLTKKTDLAGIPDYAVNHAAELAKSKKLDGWLFTLDMPSYLAIMTQADCAQLREEFYRAYVTRASDQGPNAGKWDNSAIMVEILSCRKKLATLLKYRNFAEYSLVPKMAKSPQQVLRFLTQIARKAKPGALKEYRELSAFAKKNFGMAKLQPWDVAYYSEKLKQQSCGFSSEELRAYFQLPKVLDGVFSIVKRLYGITLSEAMNVATWHPDVKVFAVTKDEELVSYLYLDLYARSEKQSGAWMHDAKARHKFAKGETDLPIVYLTCNFPPPSSKVPSLLSHGDVLTFLHELGHGLQHMLTKVDIASISGINGVPWDAVEFPSQFMENLGWEKPLLNLLGDHYKTKKKIPNSLYKKLIAARNFQAGLQVMRQLEFGLFDMRLHLEFNDNSKNQTQHILDKVRKEVAVIPFLSINRFQNSFSHIFAGGYAAGYYSYKWAEVLACDAFAKFLEDGVFNKETGQSFLHNILEVGGSVDPMIAFRKFRGRVPDIRALLRHHGIIK